MWIYNFELWTVFIVGLMPNLLGDDLTSCFLQTPRLNSCNHTPEVHVSFCIRWYLQKWVVFNLRGIFGHSGFHYVKLSSLDMERIVFLQIFIGFSWLCGTSFDVMMTVCWMLWRFYLFWSSLLCLWLCWQISVSFCWCQNETSVRTDISRCWYHSTC